MYTSDRTENVNVQSKLYEREKQGSKHRAKRQNSEFY